MIISDKNNKEIYKKDYTVGAYLRKYTRGYFQFLRYNYGTLKIDKSKGNEVFIDYFIDELYTTNMINKEEKCKYYKALKEYFFDFDKLEYKTDEEIYGDIYEIRKKIFGEKFLNIVNDKVEKELKLIANKKSKDDFEKMLSDLIYYDLDKKYREYKSPINQMEYFISEVINKKGKLIFIPDNYKQLYYLLRFVIKVILPNWAKNRIVNDAIKYYLKNCEVIIFLKKERVCNEPLISDFQYIKNKKLIDNLDIYLNSKLIKIKEYNNKSAGLDLTKLEGENKKIFEKAVNNDYKVIGLGGKSMFSLKYANFDYFILSSVNSIEVQRYTNIYTNGKKTVPYILAYLIKEFSIYEDFSGNERIKESIYHYNYVLNKFGINEKTRKFFKNNKNVIIKLIPQLYVNFYSNTYVPKRFLEFNVNEIYDFNLFIKEREKKFNIFISKKMKEDFNGKYINNCYDDKIFITGLVFNDISNIKLKPIEAEYYNESLISPRDFIKKNNLSNELYFYVNFLYFITENIKELYNEVRNKLPQEKITIENSFLGYKYINNDKEDAKELFPLYNKGFIACTKDNKIIFGRRQLLGGKLKINNIYLKWDKGDVNDLNSIKDICIYTPFIENEKYSNYVGDFKKICYKIGGNRLNFIIINNKIECVRFGEVSIPSIGVVLSIKGQYIPRLIKELGLQKKEENYYKITKSYKINVKLQEPDDISKKIWDNLIWAFGGATILVEDGKNLVSDYKNQMLNFKKEGWFHPLSKQTQETQVQEWTRGPRTVIGLTKKEQFFAVTFSGRTKESIGANFDEVVDILNKDIGEVKWALNLDGGASVCLGMVYKEEFFELNYPCVSNLSSAGMVRPVNSMLFIKK